MRASPDRIGFYVHHDECRFCQSKDLYPFLQFGEVPLAGGFLKKESFDDESFYPLDVVFCRKCALVQVDNAVPAEVLFKNYFYFSSAIGTLVTHFKELADEVAARKPRLVVEIGCNDGVFLKPLIAKGVRAVGVDPATNVVKSSGLSEREIVNDCFTEKVARRIREQDGPADAIVSSFSFAHIDDMVDVMNGVKALLADDGIFIFEVYYLGIVLDEMQYDMIYHEHMSYYSLIALRNFFERFGLEIYDCKKIALRAGTIRFYARKKTGKPPTEAVTDLLAYEKARGIDKAETYTNFGEKVAKTKRDLMRLLDDLKRQKKSIIGYGASGRATTIMTYCGIDTRYLDYVVDDAPAKHGFYTPGTHVAIKPWSATEAARPDYVLCFAWSFIEEVKKKRADYLKTGGKFIVPLPEVKVFSGEGLG